MHRPHRIVAKLNFTPETRVEPSAFVPVFHRWIQRQAVDQLLIDVHNYAHVHQGTGILLVGHEGDYAIDQQDGVCGLLYRLKRGEHETLGASLQTALSRLAQGVLLLEKDFSLRGKVRIDPTHLDFAIADRLGYPNTVETFSAIKEELLIALESTSGATDVSLERIDNDAREPLAVRATVPAGVPIAALAAGREAVGTA